jgi:hypothetical protein
MKKAKPTTKEERLAQALRANLRRRKQPTVLLSEAQKVPESKD